MAKPISITYPASTPTGAQTPISLDYYMAPVNVAWELIVPGGTTFSGTIDHTYDDFNMPGSGATIANTTWTSTAAITSTTEGTFSIPIPFMRLTITSISGGPVILKVNQGFSIL